MNKHQENYPTRQEISDLIAAKRFTDAITALEAISLSSPLDAGIWRQLGFSHAELTHWQAAIGALEKSIGLDPDSAPTYSVLGRVYLATEELDKAADCFTRSLEIDDAQPALHKSLARIRIKQRNFLQAEDHLKRALEITPDDSGIYTSLARLEDERGNRQGTMKYLEKALSFEPDSVIALSMMGSVLHNTGQTDEAAACYRKALAIDPGCVQSQAGLVSIHEYKGETDKAMELLDPLIRKDLLNPTLAAAFARMCKHVGRCDDAVDYITRILASPVIAGNTRIMLHFAAGKALDSMKHYDDAFAHYKAGNDLDVHEYDTVGHMKSVSTLIDTFTPELLMRLPRSGVGSKRPIFIVGMPRSGTSLTEQILAAHPAVHAGGELEALNDIVRQLQTFPDSDTLAARVGKLGQENVDHMARQYLDALRGLSKDAERVTDKMPHNFYHLGFIQLMFPDARIIHCRRDPLDTGLSIYLQRFFTGHKYANSLFNIGTHYHQYLRLMEYWNRVLSLPILEICYEDLVGNQETVTRRLLEFCQLEWDDRCLRFHTLDRTITTASYDQVRQPIYSKSIERWRHYESHLGDLKEGLARGH